MPARRAFTAFAVYASLLVPTSLAQDVEALRRIAEASLAAHPRIDHPHRPGSPPNPPGDDFVQGVPGDDIELTAVFPVSVTTGENGGFDLFNAVDPADPRPGENLIPHFYSGVNGRGADQLGDRYLLGDSRSPYYLGIDNDLDDDFARILDIDQANSTIVLHGSPSEYVMVDVATPEIGTAVFYLGGGVADMIGFVADEFVLDPLDPIYEYAEGSILGPSDGWLEGLAQLGAGNADLILSVALDAAGRIFAIGVSRSDLAAIWPEIRGDGNLFAVAHDQSGTRIWSTRFGSPVDPDTDLAWDLSMDGSALFVVGRYLGADTGELKDAFVAKLDIDTGEILQEAIWGGLGTQFAGAVALDDRDYVYVSGIGRDIDDPSQTDQDPYIEKRRRSDLFVVTRETFGAGTNKEPWGGLAFAPDGAGIGSGVVYSSGWTEENFSGPGFTGGDAWLAAFDEELNQLWVEQWGSSDRQREWPWDLDVDDLGFVYVVGYTFGDMDGPGSQLGRGDGFLSKFDPAAPDGERRLWTRHIGTPFSDEPRRVRVVGDRIVVAGHTYGSLTGAPNEGRSDLFVATFDLDGTLMDVEQFGSPGDDRTFLAADDATIVLGGYTTGALTSASNGFLDGYVLRLAPDLTLAPFSDRDGDGYLPGADCDELDARSWAIPGQARDLRLVESDGETSLSWLPPESPGCVVSVLAYDLVRSTRPDDLSADAACVASGLDDTQTFDAAAPQGGSVFFYVVRASNPCGAGTLGSDSAGVERVSNACD